jgi:hypothetical protein
MVTLLTPSQDGGTLQVRLLITGAVTWYLPSFQVLRRSFRLKESKLSGILGKETEGAMPEGCLGAALTVCLM